MRVGIGPFRQVFGKKLPDRPSYSSITWRNRDLLGHHHLLAILLATVEGPRKIRPSAGSHPEPVQSRFPKARRAHGPVLDAGPGERKTGAGLATSARLVPVDRTSVGVGGGSCAQAPPIGSEMDCNPVRSAYTGIPCDLGYSVRACFARSGCAAGGLKYQYLLSWNSAWGFLRSNV